MIPALNYKQVCRNIIFPVYTINSEEIYKQDGLIFLDGRIIDDRNQDGDTIGKRRLATEHKVASLGKVCFSYVEMLNSKKTRFIDTYGRAFIYERTKVVRVESHRINKKIAKDTFTLLFLKNINCPYVVPRYPHTEEWAQILMYNKLPWKLYSLSEEPVPTFKRKI